MKIRLGKVKGGFGTFWKHQVSLRFRVVEMSERYFWYKQNILFFFRSKALLWIENEIIFWNKNLLRYCFPTC